MGAFHHGGLLVDARLERNTSFQYLVGKCILFVRTVQALGGLVMGNVTVQDALPRMGLCSIAVTLRHQEGPCRLHTARGTTPWKSIEARTLSGATSPQLSFPPAVTEGAGHQLRFTRVRPSFTQSLVLTDGGDLLWNKVHRF